MSADQVIASIEDRLKVNGFSVDKTAVGEWQRQNTTLSIRPLYENFVIVEWNVVGRNEEQANKEYDDVEKIVRSIIQEVELEDSAIEGNEDGESPTESD